MQMKFAISPIHTSDDFPEPLTLDQKIEVFIARVRGWQIQPAIDMRERNIPHRGFAQLAVVISYLEMVGKYRAGYVGDRRSGEYFKQGMLYTFYDVPPSELALLDAFYELIRNGLYHLGVTLPNVMLFDNIPGSFMFNDKFGGLIISPDKFVNDLAIRFETFAAELRNPGNVDLRRNFEARFDFDNTPRPRKGGPG